MKVRIHIQMQYHTHPHMPHFPSRSVSLLFLQTADGLTWIAKWNLWLNLQVSAWKMLGVIVLFRGLPMQLWLQWKPHGKAPYHQCLIPSQTCRMKSKQYGGFKSPKCIKLNPELSSESRWCECGIHSTYRKPMRNSELVRRALSRVIKLVKM